MSHDQVDEASQSKTHELNVCQSTTSCRISTFDSNILAKVTNKLVNCVNQTCDNRKQNA